MRHRLKRHRLNRFTSWREATLASLVRNLFIYQSIRTTKARALAARPLAEKLISYARKNSLAGKRLAFKELGDHKLVSRLFEDIARRFADRSSGFTRMHSLGKRRGDDAEMVIFELMEIKKKQPRKKKSKEEVKKEPEEKPGETGQRLPKEEQTEEKKAKTEVLTKEKPPITKKPSKNFLGGLRGIFKRERDAL